MSNSPPRRGGISWEEEEARHPEPTGPLIRPPARLPWLETAWLDAEALADDLGRGLDRHPAHECGAVCEAKPCRWAYIQITWLDARVLTSRLARLKDWKDS